MDNLHNKKNVFVRVLVVFFCLILVSMIVFSYFTVEPKGQINSGIVILLLLLLILVLSESFDNFSIGKLISITREAQKKEKVLQILKKENKRLMSQLITISCNQNQHQTQHHTNVYGDYHEGKNLSVERASEQEIQAKVSNERSRASEAQAEQKYRIDYRNLEWIAMQKYVLQKGVYAENIISEAKLVTKFFGIDPISDYQPIFDGYYKDDDKEIFIELKIINRGFLFSSMSREKLYMMLSKLNHYKNAKGANVHLDLVLLNIEEDESNNRNSSILQNFGPAISSGLLKINEIIISKEEFDSCKKIL